MNSSFQSTAPAPAEATSEGASLPEKEVIYVACPACGNGLNLMRHHLGIAGNCVHCQTPMRAVDNGSGNVVVENLTHQETAFGEPLAQESPSTVVSGSEIESTPEAQAPGGESNWQTSTAEQSPAAGEAPTGWTMPESGAAITSQAPAESFAGGGDNAAIASEQSFIATTDETPSASVWTQPATAAAEEVNEKPFEGEVGSPPSQGVAPMQTPTPNPATGEVAGFMNSAQPDPLGAAHQPGENQGFLSQDPVSQHSAASPAPLSSGASQSPFSPPMPSAEPGPQELPIVANSPAPSSSPLEEKPFENPLPIGIGTGSAESAPSPFGESEASAPQQEQQAAPGNQGSGLFEGQKKADPSNSASASPFPSAPGGGAMPWDRGGSPAASESSAPPVNANPAPQSGFAEALFPGQNPEPSRSGDTAPVTIGGAEAEVEEPPEKEKSSFFSGAAKEPKLKSPGQNTAALKSVISIVRGLVIGLVLAGIGYAVITFTPPEKMKAAQQGIKEWLQPGAVLEDYLPFALPGSEESSESSDLPSDGVSTSAPDSTPVPPQAMISENVPAPDPTIIRATTTPGGLTNPSPKNQTPTAVTTNSEPEFQ